MVPLPGKAMPSASQRQFIELAVNMPEHEPQVGQALCSSRLSCSAEILPLCSSATPLKTEIRSDFTAAGRRWAGRSPSACWAMPAAIGPPLTKTVGMFTRIDAISMPGTILSQFGMQTMPSKQCARTMDSTQSAINSREGSEYFMPPWPMAMPSSTPMVLKIKGTPPGVAHQPFDEHAHLVEMGVAGDAIGVGIDNGDKGLVPVRIGFNGTGGAQERAVRRAFRAFFDNIRAHH